MLLKLLLTNLISIVLTFIAVTYLFFNSLNFSFGERINFQTRNGEFKFMAMPSKGRDHLMMERRFESYRLENKELTDTILYRTTPINYFRISKWCWYKGAPEWQYPYLFKIK